MGFPFLNRETAVAHLDLPSSGWSGFRLRGLVLEPATNGQLMKLELESQNGDVILATVTSEIASPPDRTFGPDPDGDMLSNEKRWAIQRKPVRPNKKLMKSRDFVVPAPTGGTVKISMMTEHNLPIYATSLDEDYLSW